MKRYTSTILIALTVASISTSLSQSKAQGRYGYRTAPNGDCEVIDHRYSRTPILDRIRQDLRVVHEEVNRAFYGTRDEVRRAVHGGPPETYYDPNVNRSWGNFDAEFLAEVRRRKAREEEQRARYEAGIRAERYRIEQMEADRDARQRAEEQKRRHAEVARMNEREHEVNRQREIQRRAKLERQQREARLERERALERESQRKLELERDRIVRPHAEPKAETRPPEPKSDPRDPVLDEKPKEESRNQAGFTEAEMKNFPFARKTDKPGHVKSPYPPFELLDVSDLEPGGLAMEPDSERIFRIPE